MLFFTIHGVATRDINYASDLKRNIRNLLHGNSQTRIHFNSGFWGNALNDIDQMWTWIEQDLDLAERKNSALDRRDCLRYKEFRETFLSEFVGDMFTYLNPKRGFNIRKILCEQLISFLADHPDEAELHIAAHSLGTIILWDMLFSERFSKNDPAFLFRQTVQGLNLNLSRVKVDLRSIITMGSPILFFNTMLDVDLEKVAKFIDKKPQNFEWLNIIHSSDIIAYPLRSSVTLPGSDFCKLRDIYIDTNVNLAAKVARSIGQDLAGMALDSGTSHDDYWSHIRVAELVANSICIDNDIRENREFMESVIEYLQSVPGMTKDKFRLHAHDRPEKTLIFADGSGKLFYIVNATKIHHVYLFDENEFCRFSGYVGWMHTGELQKAIEFIERTWS